MSKITPEFMKAHNTALAVSMLYDKVLRSKELESSVLFNPARVKDTLKLRQKLRQTIVAAETTNPKAYIASVQGLADVAESVLDLLFVTHELGIQADFLTYLRDFQQNVIDELK